MNDLRAAVAAQIEKYRPAIMRDIRELVAIESQTPDRAETRRALKFVLDRAEEMGMRTGVTRHYDAGWAEIGEGSEYVGILAHVDVVGVGDSARWTAPPFQADERDGWLYGRGVVDDKGPAVISLYALKAIMDMGVALKKRIRLIVGTSEESEWVDMAHYLEEFEPPAYGYSPDGSFPLYNIEKGYADARIIFREEGRLSEILEATSGESPNSVPSLATLTLRGGEQQTFTGTAVHSSVPEEGDNALLKLAAYAAERGFLFGRFICDVFTDQYAPPLHLDDGTDTFDGVYVGRTVCCPTIMRLTEDGVYLNVNIRARYGVDGAWLTRSFNALAEKYGYTVSFDEITEAMMVSPDLLFLREMNEAYESHGYKGGFLVAGGASYAKTMANCVCWGPIFPGEPSCAHMEDEAIKIEKLFEAMAIYLEYLIVTASK